MKHVKHILSSVLVLVLLLASVSAITAFAAGEPTVTLGSAEAEAGETVALELTLENNPGIYAICVTFKYDTTALSLGTKSADQKNGDLFGTFTRGKNPTWDHDEDEDVVDDGLMGTFYFKVAENAAPGTYEIQVTVKSANNYDEELIECVGVNGTITVKGEPEPETPTYSVAVDGNGNVLNPYFVNGNIWTETDGVLKPAEGPMENFLLFDTPLANNRVEATMNIKINGDKNTRTGIVFAVTDIGGDGEFGYAAADVSYYWVFVSGLNNLGLAEMGAAENWKWHADEVSLATLGIEAEQGITLAAEWDAEGNIKVFANGILAIEAKDATPLTGNLYGVFMRSWANTADAGFQHPHLLTSYVAGGANEAPKQVTVTADPVEGGTVTGAGDYYLGKTATVTATPAAGYNFAGWYNGETLVSSDATYTFAVTADCTLTAKFTNITYDVTVNAGANGTVAGGGVVAEGASTTVTATGNTGYKFVGWYVDDVKVSSDATYTFTVTSDVTLVAEFEKVVYTIVTDAQGNLLNPYYVNGNTWTEENGTMKPAVGAMENFILFDNALNANRIEATFTGLPANNDNNTRHGIVFAVTDIDGDNTFGMSDDGVSYYFLCVSGYGQIQLIRMGAGKSWSVYITGGSVDLSQAVTLAVEWDADGNVKVFANGELRIDQNVGEALTGNLYGVLMRSYANTLGSHTCLLHSFVAGKDTATITARPNNEGGTVTGAGEYVIGTNATLTATAIDGFKFLGWYVNDVLVSEATTYIHTVEADAEIVAKFEALVYYDVTVGATEGGNASGNNTVLAGNTATVIATPDADYNFLGWYVNGELISTETTYTFTPDADIALEARFEKKPAPVTGLDTEIKSETGETVTGVEVTTDKAGYEMGETFEVTVNVTNSEYMFIGWYQDGIFRSADLTYTDTYFEGISLVAKVVKKPENNGFAYIFGYTDEIMGAEGTLLRGEAAQIIYRLFAQAGAVNLGEGFEDMDGWYQNGLLYVSGKGLWSTSNSAYPYAVVSKGEVYKVICIGYGLTTDGSLSYSEYATILKNAGYLAEIPADLGTAILRYEFCEIINKITGRDQYELVDKDGNVITAEDYGFTDLDEADPYYKTMLIATSNFANGYVDLAGRADRDELDKVKKDEE